MHRKLPTAPDLTALAPLQHVPLDAVGRVHVLVPDLVSHVLLVGARGEQRRDPGAAQRMRGDPLADRGKPCLAALKVGLFEEDWRDHVLRDGVARPAFAAGVKDAGLPGLPPIAARGLVRRELLLKIVVRGSSVRSW